MVISVIVDTGSTPLDRRHFRVHTAVWEGGSVAGGRRSYAEAAMKFGGGGAHEPITSGLRLGKEVSTMCMVPSEVAITATTCEFGAI